MNTPAFVWLIAWLLAGAPLIYFIDRSIGKSLSAIRPQRRISPYLSLGILVAAWLPYTLAARDLVVAGPASFTLGAITLRFDGLSLVLATVALILATLVALYAGPYLARENGREKHDTLLVILAGMIIGLGCAGDIFNLWVWFEAMAIASYLLVAFYPEQPAALEAGVKYLVQSAAGSALVLLGIALVLMHTGTLDLIQIQSKATPAPVFLAAGALFLIGFGVKAALVPLHTWLPDAHSQAPSGISALLSGVVIEAGLIALLRTLFPLFALDSVWGNLLMALGAINMLIGNLLALQQTEIKRLLAYSSLSHIGYMLLGFGIAISAGQALGAQGAVFHLLTHGLMKGLAFLAAGTLVYALHLAHNDHTPLTIADLSGAARRYPFAALALSLAVLGLGGLPPLAGFMSKWQILLAGFTAHTALTSGLAIFAAANSVLSLGYYAPLVNTLYRKHPSAAVMSGASLAPALNAPLAILVTAVIILGMWPASIMWLIEPAGRAVLSVLGR